MSTRYNFDRLLQLGISYQDAVTLRRISMTLHRWHELECGDGNNHASWCISRGNKVNRHMFEYADNGRPYIETHYNSPLVPGYNPRYTLIADREKGALRRLAKIMEQYKPLGYFVQTDPRGAALYIGENLTDTNYSNGVAVYK